MYLYLLQKIDVTGTLRYMAIVYTNIIQSNKIANNVCTSDLEMIQICLRPKLKA